MRLFPHDSIRPVQKEFMESVRQVLNEGSNLIAHAPTGLGKTAATIAPALDYALEHGLTVFFLTSRHTQHAIAVDTLAAIREKHKEKFNVTNIIGKKWMCPVPGVEDLHSSEFADYCRAVREDNRCEFYERTRTKGGLSVEAKRMLGELKKAGPTHTEGTIRRCAEERLCPYEISMKLASESSVIVTDYFYIFNPKIRESFFQKASKELEKAIIIVDEGHNLPSRIKDLASERLSTMMLQRAITEAKKMGYNEVATKLIKVQDTIMGLAKEGEDEILVSKDAFVEPIQDYDLLTSELALLGDTVREQEKKSYIASVATFLDAWQGPDEGFARILSTKDSGRYPILTLSYRCLDPSLIAAPVINQSHSTIVMSGTLSPTSMYRELLGVGRAVEKTFGSPFPKENRRNLIVPLASTKFSNRSPREYEKIATITSAIADRVKGNTAIYFPSYALRDHVAQYFEKLTSREVLYEAPSMTKRERTETLQKFRMLSNPGAVLLGCVSGSFSEGVDLPGDLLSCVVIVGLPFQQPDLETKELIAYYDRKFSKGWEFAYILPAFNKALQAAGRCIRSAHDRGLVVFLDERYAYPNYRAYFPGGLDLEVTPDFAIKAEDFFR